MYKVKKKKSWLSQHWTVPQGMKYDSYPSSLIDGMQIWLADIQYKIDWFYFIK